MEHPYFKDNYILLLWNLVPVQEGRASTYPVAVAHSKDSISLMYLWRSLQQEYSFLTREKGDRGLSHWEERIWPQILPQLLPSCVIPSSHLARSLLLGLLADNLMWDQGLASLGSSVKAQLGGLRVIYDDGMVTQHGLVGRQSWMDNHYVKCPHRTTNSFSWANKSYSCSVWLLIKIWDPFFSEDQVVYTRRKAEATFPANL